MSVAAENGDWRRRMVGTTSDASPLSQDGVLYLAQHKKPSPVIRPPTTLEETGLPQSMVEELTIKGIYFLGRPTARDLTQALTLPYSALEPVLNGLKAEGLCEVRGSRGFGEHSYEYVLTDRGRDKANGLIPRRRYFGPAPVPLLQYAEVTRQQCHLPPIIDRQTLLRGLEHIVVDESLLRVLGPAVNSGEPILFHGPAGNGKTSLAMALGDILAGQDQIWVPYVVEAAGQLIKVFDPMVHQPVRLGLDEVDEILPDLALGEDYDRRWVLIKRPLVIGAAELTMSQFELTQDATSGVWLAPYQWKANGGTLLIDDLGRQAMRPQELLNRWIVPMENGKDYLALSTGQTLELPLNILLIFATNLSPDRLLDEAYLRRIPYRIWVPNPSPEQYRRIFRAVCSNIGLPYDPEAVDYLFRNWYDGHDIEMRACHPRDIVARILDICRFMGLEPSLSPDLVEQAATLCLPRPSCSPALDLNQSRIGAPEGGPGNNGHFKLQSS